MEKKHIAGIWAVVLGIGAAIAFPHVRWGLFSMKAGETVQKLDRYAEASQVIALRAAVLQDAQKYKLDPAKLQVGIVLDERSMMGATTFWFVVVTVSDGSRTFKAEDKIERSIDEAYEAALGEAGIRVQRMPARDSAIQLPGG